MYFYQPTLLRKYQELPQHTWVDKIFILLFRLFSKLLKETHLFRTKNASSIVLTSHY